MPCESGPSWEDLRREKRERDTMARLSCDRCKWLEKHGGIPDWAKEWWESHKALDLERKREKLEERKSKATRARALAKLTHEEREELGL